MILSSPSLGWNIVCGLTMNNTPSIESMAYNPSYYPNALFNKILSSILWNIGDVSIKETASDNGRNLIPYIKQAAEIKFIKLYQNTNYLFLLFCYWIYYGLPDFP